MKALIRIAAITVAALVLAFGYLLTIWPESASVYTM